MSFYKMERGWHDNEFFLNSDEPYSQKDAWCWMIGEAQWKPCTKNILGKPIKLDRGQFSHSIRFMAKKFKWGEKKVRCFLEKLQKWEMVGTDRGTGQLIITICNYSKYQDNAVPEGHSKGRGKGTRGAHEGHKEEEGKESKEGKEKNITRPSGVSESVWADFKKLRRAKRAPITETVIKKITSEAEKANWPLEEVLKECCTRGWQGFEAEWVKSKAREGLKRGYQGM